MAHIGQSRPDPGLGLPVKVLKPFKLSLFARKRHAEARSFTLSDCRVLIVPGACEDRVGMGSPQGKRAPKVAPINLVAL